MAESRVAADDATVAVVAHALRNSVAIVETALRTLELALTDEQRAAVLGAALGQTVHIGAVLEDLVRALPDDALEALADLDTRDRATFAASDDTSSRSE